MVQGNNPSKECYEGIIKAIIENAIEGYADKDNW